MDNWLMILIFIGMVVLFVGPFIVLSSYIGHHRQDARQKQKTGKQECITKVISPKE